MIDWTTVLSTFIGAVAGAVVAGWLAVTIAKRDRPRPVWQISEPEIFQPQGNSLAVGLIYRITNVGNGEAYAVTATQLHGRESDEPRSKALVRPGKSIGIGITFLVGGLDEPYPMGARNPHFGVWKEGTAIVLTWEEAPGFRRTKTHRFLLDMPMSGHMRFQLKQ